MSENIHRSLFIGGGLLLALYALAVIRVPRLLTLETPSAPSTAQPPAEVSGVFYKITGKAGDVHVQHVSGLDPTEIMAAAAAVGPDAHVERLDPAEAAALLASKRVKLPWGLLLLVFPISLVLAGRVARRRLREAQAVWTCMQPTLSVEAKTLRRKTGLGDERIGRVLQGLKRIGLADLLWDEKVDRVYDRRLSAFTLTVPFCLRCNAAIDLRVAGDLNQLPTCPVCLGLFDRTQLEIQTRDIAARLGPVGGAKANGASAAHHFSPWSFALWALCFPPMAIIYALSFTP